MNIKNILRTPGFGSIDCLSLRRHKRFRVLTPFPMSLTLVLWRKNLSVKETLSFVISIPYTVIFRLSLTKKIFLECDKNIRNMHQFQ